MPKITALRLRGRTTDRYVLELDGKAFATLDLALIDRFSPHVGDELDDATRAALAAAAATLETYDRALRMLASRGRASADLVRRLIQKGAAPADARAAADRLRTLGYLDDTAFARAYVRRKCASHGRRRLEADLARQGVHRDEIRAALDAELPASADERTENVVALVTRRRRSLAALDPATRRRRLVAFLARRGFGPRDADTALRALGLDR